MWVYGILPGSRAKHVPVPRLPTSNVRHGRDGHAPHASAADRLVLGDLSVCHGQTRHFCRPAESYAEHLLWVGVASFARKMARLCSRGCRLLKTSPAARFSRSLTKLLRQVQKSNATATDSIAEKPAIRSSCAWQEPSPHLVHSCIKPISKFQNMTTSAQRQKTPRDPTSGIAGVRGEDLRFRPSAGALGGGFPADGQEKGRQHGEESRAESGGGAGRSGRV